MSSDAPAAVSRGPDQDFSLLWPDGRSAMYMPGQSWLDLGMERIVAALTLDERRADAIGAIVRSVPTDERTVAYRLAITNELLTNEALGDCIQEVVPVIERLRYYVSRPSETDWTSLQEVTWRIRELEHYVEALEVLDRGFSRTSVQVESEGLRGLMRAVKEARQSPIFARIKAELPSMLEAVKSFRSVSIGINLGAGLEPVEATILSIGTEPYRGSGLAGRLLAESDHVGIARLHSTATAGAAANPLMVPLFRDLSALLKSAARPLEKALTQFAALNTYIFVSVADELLFYSGALRLARRLRAAGLPVCHPELLSADCRAFEARALYNLDLAIRRLDSESAADVVMSDVHPPTHPAIAIVTGPNSGGKTTFLQGVGLAQIMCQLGLFGPGAMLTFSAADAIHTHYPALEHGEDESGRFAEETRRLRDVLVAVTPRSLVLLNESLSSTAMGEAVYLARDVVTLLAEVGCRAVYVTHMHDLVANCGGTVFSLVAQARLVNGDIVPTYRLEPGIPEGKSYAAALAARYGLELQALRKARDVLAASGGRDVGNADAHIQGPVQPGVHPRSDRVRDG
jgi:DNA mismatch repair protein MutS